MPDEIAVNDSNTFVYPSTAGAELVELPKPGTSRGEVETIQIQALGRHIANKVEAAFGHVRCLPYKDTQDPAKVMSHYLGAVRGAGVLDEASTGKLAQLSRGMAESRNPEQFFRDSVRTFLLNLTVGAR